MAEEELDWDDICVNPHEYSVAQGREEGRLQGQKAGYEEGRKLGQTTAIDYGVELGFVQGILETLARSDLEKHEKVIKTLRDLQKLVDEFPDAQAVFEQAQSPSGNDDDGQVENDSQEPSEENASTTTTTKDLRQLMQRIRTRFRLLMVQLKMPHISLYQVMNQTVAESSTLVSSPSTAEW